MAIDNVIIDTNAYAAFKKGQNEAVEIVKSLDRIILNPIVVGELISGFVIGTKEEQNRKELIDFLEFPNVALLEISQQTSEYFAQIYKELRTKGRPIPTNDMWFASTAKEYELGIFTYDSHFRELDNLTIISKLSDLP